jgi:hypothetical protein
MNLRAYHELHAKSILAQLRSSVHREHAAMKLLPSANRDCFHRSILLVVAFVVAMSLLTFGSTSALYVAQNAAGSDSGVDCSNAHSAAWFNSNANWGANSSQIGPGSTVHLCGTFTGSVNATILTIHGSGTTGKSITILWESGASLTSPACSACIQGNGNSYLVFDGNCAAPCATPSITNTANGSSLANQIGNGGIQASPCQSCEFKNLTITNIYVHNSPSDTTNGDGLGIDVNGSNWSVHDSYFDQMYIGINSAYQNGDTNVQIYNNTVDHFNWGIHIGNNAPSSLSNVFIHNNHLKNMNNWDTTTDAFHHDGLFVVQNNYSASITNVQMYNNLFDGLMSTCSPNTCATAWIYYNTGMNGIYIYNNVILGDGSSFLLEGGVTGDKNFYFYNNFLSCTSGAPTGNQALAYSNVQGFVFQNNAVQNCSTSQGPFYLVNITSKAFDYNVYQNYKSGETHSLDVSSLVVDSSGVPQVGSPLIHNGTSNFLNLGPSCNTFVGLCSDYAGGARPSSGSWNWESGAYMLGSSQHPNPPTGLVAVVN